MAVPVPVDIAIDSAPANFTGEYLTDILALIARSLSGTMEVELLTGQIGGSQPGSNVGPWLNGTEWYYWTGSAYHPTGQGCPVGTVAIWGGVANVPANWTICEGQTLSASVYPELFAAIGHTWGGGGNHFKLPPPAVFYLNAPNFGNVNDQGGSQTVLIPSAALPPLQIQLLYLNADMINNNLTVPNTQGAGTLGYYYPVEDESGVVVGSNQHRIPIMPPFAAAYFIIKYL